MSTSGVNTAGFYADFGALGALKKDVKAGNDPQAIREAARQFESLFTDMMLKAMRAAKLGNGLGDSEESDLYQEMYDQQLALQMSQGRGLGLADLLVQQLTRSAATKGASGAPAPTGAATGAAAAAGATGNAPAATGNGSAGAPATTHAQKISFVQMLTPYAQRAGAQLGVAPESLIAQAALETGWGQHVPSGDSGSSHNLFGIKAGGSWQGASVAAATQEYQQGAAVGSMQSFRSYASLQQGMNDYVNLLQASAALQPALGTGTDVAAFASALQRGGYATDPHYAAKLTATAGLVQSLRAGIQAAALKLPALLPKTSGGESA